MPPSIIWEVGMILNLQQYLYLLFQAFRCIYSSLDCHFWGQFLFNNTRITNGMIVRGRKPNETSGLPESTAPAAIYFLLQRVIPSEKKSDQCNVRAIRAPPARLKISLPADAEKRRRLLTICFHLFKFRTIKAVLNQIRTNYSRRRERQTLQKYLNFFLENPSIISLILFQYVIRRPQAFSNLCLNSAFNNILTKRRVLFGRHCTRNYPHLICHLTYTLCNIHIRSFLSLRRCRSSCRSKLPFCFSLCHSAQNLQFAIFPPSARH